MSSYYNERFSYYSRFYAIWRISLLFFLFIFSLDIDELFIFDGYYELTERFILLADVWGGFIGGSFIGLEFYISVVAIALFIRGTTFIEGFLGLSRDFLVGEDYLGVIC